ncbi:MAG: hypothetical protein OEN01_05315 [Candidatus Krumholzibacteria bacterium]|nr:hypothetical protein [Candidatus Krumholzibacteria bacterium]
MLLTYCERADAYFERIIVSSRAFALGGAFVALADDPGATVVNAAGLTQIRSLSVLSSFDIPYDISDLQENYLALALPAKFGVLGFSWYRFALSDVTSEDLFTFAYGRDYIRTSQDASLSFGASIDVARVAYSSVYTDSKTVVTGSLSVLLRPFPIIGMGYSIRNLGQPSFDWVLGDGRTVVKTTQTLGVAYYWDRRSVFVYERARAQDGKWADRVGIEVHAGKELDIRGGLANGDVTGGVGLTVSGIALDVGVSGHETLGLTYHFSVGFAMPSKKADGLPNG